jgi:hypothetical protein
MKIGKAGNKLNRLIVKVEKMGNEAILHVFFVIFINEIKAHLSLKWKKWEVFFLCFLIDTHEIAYQ